MKLLAIDTAAAAPIRRDCGRTGPGGRIRPEYGEKTTLWAYCPYWTACCATGDYPYRKWRPSPLPKGRAALPGCASASLPPKPGETPPVKPLIGIRTTDALARAAGVDGYVCPLLDARRDQVYTALFRDGQRLWPDLALSPDEVGERLAQLDAPVCCLGDGFAPYEDLLRQRLGDRLRPALPERRLVLAPAAAMLAWSAYCRGTSPRPRPCSPSTYAYRKRKKNACCHR